MAEMWQRIRKKAKWIFRSKHTAGIVIAFWTSGSAVALASYAPQIPMEAFYLAYALLIAALIWSIGAFFTSEFIEKRSPFRRNRNSRKAKRKTGKFRVWQVSGSLGIFVLFAFCIWVTRQVQTSRELSEMFGVLYPANEPTPNGQCVLDKGEVGLYLGDYSVKTATFPITVVQIHGKPVVTLDRNKDGSIALTMGVRSDDDKIIARIDRNGFTVNQNNYLSMKRTDRSSLVVTDQYGVEVLNARYLNNRAFRLNAKLHSSGITADFSDLHANNICFAVPNSPQGSRIIFGY